MALVWFTKFIGKDLSCTDCAITRTQSIATPLRLENHVVWFTGPVI